VKERVGRGRAGVGKGLKMCLYIMYNMYICIYIYIIVCVFV